jgi:Heterokaryon incompatibility protein Het-C
MKNYIANESGGWATSAGYVKHSFTRAIHFGRVYTSGAHGTRGKEEDFCEALRCLGQALHTLEDFGAHTNYVELSLRELGYHNVFTHTGTQTEMTVRGKRIYPLVTGTFGGVDFLHSVLGEATDHITQSEVDEVNTALLDAATGNQRAVGPSSLNGLCDVLGKVPGTSDLIHEARQLQATSDEQTRLNAIQSHSARSAGATSDPFGATRADDPQRPLGAGSSAGGGVSGIQSAAQQVDPAAVIAKIYPILRFRDNVVRAISAIISKIPGLENLIETITERVTLFVLSLLAPFVIPLIKVASNGLKTGSSGVIDASAKAQYEPWNNPQCTDPTHSLLSKDHFSNILNEPAGHVATVIIQYVAPRVIYAWDHPEIEVQQVLDDVCRVFHHPALRDRNLEIHRNMFSCVEKWAQNWRGADLNTTLSSASVKVGKNHQGGSDDQMMGPGGHGHSHGGAGSSSTGGFQIPGFVGTGNLPSFLGGASQTKVVGSPFELFTRNRELGEFGGPGEIGYSTSSATAPDITSSSSYSQSYESAPYGQQAQTQEQQPYAAPSAGGDGQTYNPPQSSDPYAYGGGTNYGTSYNDSYSQTLQQPQSSSSYYGQQLQPEQQYPPTQYGQQPQPPSGGSGYGAAQGPQAGSSWGKY